MNNHHQLEISVEENETESWRERCNRRIESLKAREFSSTTEDQPSPSIIPIHHETSSENTLELQEAVQNGNVDEFLDVLENISSSSSVCNLSAIFEQVSPSGDSLLHDAVFFGREEISEIISHHFPQLLTKKNGYGDTPLHVAARRSNSSILIQVILFEHGSTRVAENINDDDEEERNMITRITNEYGNTALHEAVYGNNIQGAVILFDADRHVVHCLNNLNVSPLCLAVQSSNRELVDLWLEAEDVFPENYMDLPSSHGVSPLHAAICTKHEDLLKLMVEKESYLKLMMNLRDEHGRTPIHFAAITGYVEGVRVLLEKSTSIAQEFDMKGHLPIHLAAKRGHVEVVKEFCERRKLSLRGLVNKKGQNILHVAAKHGHEDVVKYLLRNIKLDEKLLDVNQKDKNGNTPLHLAAQNLHYSTVLSLSLDKRIEVNAMNNEGFTARDLVLLKREPIQTGVVQEIAKMVLKFAGAKESDKAKSLLKRREPPLMKPDVMENKMDTLIIVTILIVAVTFIAGFTVPGGVYSSQDPNPHNRGTAILAHKPMFKLFAIFNMVVYSSIFGSFFLLWAQIGTLSAVALLAIIVTGPIMLFLHLLDVVH